VDEVRLVADLRIMHARVYEIYNVCNMIRSRHTEKKVVEYADPMVLNDDIQKMQQVSNWFLQVQGEMLNGQLINHREADAKPS
jgi:flagellar assembly factor FliW